MDTISPEARARIDTLVENPNNLSERTKVRLWRIAKGINSAEMARKLGRVTASAVTAFEMNHLGARYMVRSTLERYINALGLTTEEFYSTSPLTHPSVGPAARACLWRAVSGLSTKELAGLAGVGVYTLTNAFTHRADPHWKLPGETALKVTKALGIPFDLFMQGLQAPEPPRVERAPRLRGKRGRVKNATGVKTITEGGANLPLTRRRYKEPHGFQAHPEHIFSNMKKNGPTATQQQDPPVETTATERTPERDRVRDRVYEAIVNIKTAYALLGEALAQLDLYREVSAALNTSLWDAGPLVPGPADLPTSRR